MGKGAASPKGAKITTPKDRKAFTTELTEGTE
jgi:hypothetical protein